jgi:curved DNA-binding protein CbpA
MGLPDQPLAADALRRRYRELMKRYHPDVNPSGLERCKEINAAYAVLMSREEKGANAW